MDRAHQPPQTAPDPPGPRTPVEYDTIMIPHTALAA
ncbi:hypothetical protein SFR_7057 (plasmid) [Streptomyces sp. FR-008]|nr:hypothetical protein SFR_7057 [Streptomyces sp. FR-008]